MCHHPNSAAVSSYHTVFIRIGVSHSLFTSHQTSEGSRLEHATRTTLLLLFLLYPRHIGLADGVPGLHIFLHTRRQARFLAFGQGGSGFGDAAFEAVFVKFLLQNTISQSYHAVLGGSQIYLDKHARILHGSFLLYLAHDLSLGVGKGTRALGA
jgi:hypothetical protein